MIAAVKEAIALRQQARRQSVLQSALRVFSAKGYRGASMLDIAAEAGMGKASLYHYISSKEEVLTDLYEEVLRENVIAVRSIVGLELTATQALREVIADRVIYTCQNKELLNVFFEEEAELPPRLYSRLVAVRREYEDAVMSIVIRGQADNEFTLPTSPRVYVSTILGAANWAYKWYDASGQLSPEELGERMADILIHGVAPRPAAVSAAPADARG
jgi:TetR/AcrR family transcriptional regulator, cholesterol catabolism regulator